MKAKHSGFGVGSALLLGLLVLTLGLGLAAASTTHLRLLAVQENQAVCEDLGKSLIAMACEKMIDTPAFRSSLQLDEPQGWPGLVQLTFDGEQAERWDLPVSLNNLGGGGTQVSRTGLLVPRDCLYLAALAQARGQKKLVEAIYHLPPFPYAIASDGLLQSSGGLLVGSVSDAGQTSLDPLQPSHLASNSRQARAIVLGASSLVKGDAQACGGIELDPQARVEGRLQPNHQPIHLPHYRLPSFDPLARGLQPSQLPSLYPGDLSLSGASRAASSCTIDGDLQLDGGLLYVDGDLTIRGNLSGRGAVIATGALQIDHQVRFGAQDGLAVLAGGKLRLRGENRESSQLRGIVYTEGGLEAQDISLWGALISRQGVAGSADVQLERCAVVENRALQDLSFSIAPAPASPSAPPTTLYVPISGIVGQPGAGTYQLGQPVTTAGRPPYMVLQLSQQGNSLTAMVTLTNVPGQSIHFQAFRASGSSYQDFMTALLEQFQSQTTNNQFIFDSIPEPSTFGFPSSGGTLPPVQGGGGPVEFDFDPSQFLTVRERIRLVLWKES